MVPFQIERGIAGRPTRERPSTCVVSGQTAVYAEARAGTVQDVIVLGLILLVIGFVAKVAILWTLGIILIVVGAILALMGGMGRAIGGRRHYY
jgi:Family of unknown function (DUF6131)